ncbi:hypothetical protein niasHS_010833 [Heterodera schachtii]|uniref:Peptidase S54 rhomboid domain-containing protein n=1 Tax=Heterodera schachtii TaxID=97005 RepID=A0ABD2IUN6_HETSC
MDDEKWSQRRFRHLNKQYGIKAELLVSDKVRSCSRLTETFCYVDGDSSVPTSSSRNAVIRALSLNRQPRGSGIIEQKESVFQMALSGLSSVLHGRQITRSASRRRHNQMPTYLSVRKRDKNFVCSSSFPSNRQIQRYFREDPTFFGATPIEIPFSLPLHSQSQTPAEQPKFYTPSHDNEQAHEEELDDVTAHDVLFFEESPGRSPAILATETNNRQIGRQVAIEPLKTVSKLQRVLRLMGFGDKEVGSGIRSRVKFNFSVKQKAKRVRRLPIFGNFRPNVEVARRLKDTSSDYRPYFTYWISTVHLLITFFMLIFHGIGTDYSNGLNVIERSGDVMGSSLSPLHIVVWEQNNIWMGPRFADLVHTGAKFTPCMRRDDKIFEQIIEERKTEAESTGCCVGLSGCFQTSECSKQFATLLKWTNGTFPEMNYSRVVCGQDPRYCARPRSVHPYVWGLNISNWPICEKHSPSIPKSEKHMHCTVTGRPCCIQMHGQCRITSREYCDFVRGHFHPNATLCSQISCLNEVCGMTPFLRRDIPDQLYRLFTPLFINAGIIRCVISLTLYLTIMCRFEIMIGWLRLSSIYFVSGIGGYLASAVFVPYMPEVGPVGSEGGILGALIVNVLYNWDYLDNPLRALMFHLLIAVILLLTGFLPYIDNWAQLFGFIFGSLMALVVIPYFSFGSKGGDKRLLVITVASTIMALLLAFLLVLFFFFPLNYELLGLLNCPFSAKICDHHGLILRNWLPI